MQFSTSRSRTSELVSNSSALSRALSFPLAGWLALFALYPLASAHAQESGPRSFYQNDFAAAPGVAGEAGGGQPRRAASRQSAPAPGGLQAPVAAGSREPKKRKMLASVVVNSLDRKHFNAVIDSVLKLHDARLALVTAVLHVGDYRSVTPELEASLLRRGIQIIDYSFPPDAGTPPLSPRWEIVTKDGTHIAEGFLSLEPFINEWGEYSPTIKEEKLPDVTPGGF